MGANVLRLSVWIAYFIVPVAGWGLFSGRPLGLLSTTMLAAVCWTAFAAGTVRASRAAAAALVLKVALGATLVAPRGFEAKYYANADFAGPFERSADYADRSFTRIDRRLRFGVERESDAPLAFLNDLRFNYYRDNEPDRATLPFSVTWQGLWHVTRGGPQQLYVRSPAGAALVIVDQALSARVEASDAWRGDVTLEPGWHRLTIGWSVRQGGARRFEAGYLTDGRETPFDEGVVFRRPLGRAALAADAVVRVIGLAVDVLLLAWIAAQFLRTAASVWERLRGASSVHDQASAIWAAGLADALIFAMPAAGRMITLSGGDDWLSYESLGRDIVLHGVWMNQGAPLGQGAPFYAQPLYPYFLALAHWLFGDGLFGPYFVQRLLVAGCVVALWRTAAVLFDESVGVVALITALVVAYEKLAAGSGVLLTETLFVPLVCLWIYLLVRVACASKPARWSVAAGLVGGLATLARSSLLVGWAVAIPAVILSMPRRRSTVTASALIVGIMLAVCSLATIRNWVASHQLVFITSEGQTVLFLGNSPPALSIPAEYKTRYERLGLDPRLQAVVEYARQQPQAFARGLWRKARFTLGWFGTMLPGAGTSTFYIAEWVLALAGFALVVARPRPFQPSVVSRPGAPAAVSGLSDSEGAAAVPLALKLVPLLVALSHFAVVVLFQPHVYGDRLIMPLYVVLVPVVALPVAVLARYAKGIGTGRLAAVLWTVVLAIAIGQLSDYLPDVDLDVVALALLAAGVFAFGAPRLPVWRSALYAAYALAFLMSFVQTPSAAAAWTMRHELLFVVLALFSSAFIADVVVRRAVVWTVVALAGIAAARLAAGGFPGPLALATASLRNAVGYGSVAAAAAGLLGMLVAVAVPGRLKWARRSLAYPAAAALVFSAIHWMGALVDPRVAFFRMQLAAAGIAGAGLYAVIWMEGAWPSGNQDRTFVLEGMVLGTFAAALCGAQFGAAAGALSIAAGLTFGAIHADRL